MVGDIRERSRGEVADRVGSHAVGPLDGFQQPSQSDMRLGRSWVGKAGRETGDQLGAILETTAQSGTLDWRGLDYQNDRGRRS